MINTHFNLCYQKVSTLDKSSFIQIVIALSLTVLVFFCLYGSMLDMTNQTNIKMEMQFIDTFFYQVDLLNSNYVPNAKHDKEVPLDFKTLNTTLSKTDLELLNNIGLFYHRSIVDNKSTHDNAIGQINSYLGVAMIYPYTLSNRIDGKVSQEEEKRDLKLSYTLAYPTVTEDLCINFLSYLKNNPISYHVVINNIEIGQDNSMGSLVLENNKNFSSICKTTHKNPYNTIYISN